MVARMVALYSSRRVDSQVCESAMLEPRIRVCFDGVAREIFLFAKPLFLVPRLNVDNNYYVYASMIWAYKNV
jgi:hypothetical protein